MHRSKGGYGSSKGFAYGCRVQMESPTESMVEICRIAERAVLIGRLFLFWLSSQGETDERNNQKYRRGRTVHNPSLRTGAICGAENGDSAWRPFQVYRAIGYCQNAELPAGGTGCQALPTEHRNTAEALKLYLLFERGHWFERGVHQALIGYGLSPLAQLEIEITYGSVPIKAPLDFALIATQPQPAVRILEVKSTARLPTTLSENHAM